MHSKKGDSLNKKLLLLFVLIIFTSLVFASSPIQDVRTILATSIKTVAPSGEIETIEFSLSSGQTVSSTDLSGKTELDVSSIYFAPGNFVNGEYLSFSSAASSGSSVFCSGNVIVRLHAMVICKQNAVNLDNSLKQFSLDKNLDLGPSPQSYCGDSMPCCAIILLKDSVGSYSAPQETAFWLWGMVIAVFVIIVIVAVSFWLIYIFRKNLSALMGLNTIYALPGLGWNGWLLLAVGASVLSKYPANFTMESFLLLLLFFVPVFVYFVSIFVYFKQIPVEKKLFWLKTLTVLQLIFGISVLVLVLFMGLLFAY